MPHSPRQRASAFCKRFGIEVPILLGPMAGACPPSLSIAVANAGGAGSCGALLMPPDAIRAWHAEFRAKSNGLAHFNLWIPEAPPHRDAAHEAELRAFLGQWGPAVPPEATNAGPPDFAAQIETILALRPQVISSVMGLYAPKTVARIKQAGIAWFACVSTVREAKAAEAAGANVIIAQGAEAGGHRAAFDPALAERQTVGLFALLPAVVDAVRVPVVATGGIADGRGVAAAVMLGASAAQIGTGFLRCPEAQTNPAWADALAATMPEDTMVSRVFSGRPGRSIATAYALAAARADAPAPAPYPVQRALTAAMREAGGKVGDVERMQAWAGQSAALARAEPAGDVVARVWAEAQAMLA